MHRITVTSVLLCNRSEFAAGVCALVTDVTCEQREEGDGCQGGLDWRERKRKREAVSVWHAPGNETG
jgi:hypothetical protein